MKYKLIALDLDGTLKNSNNEITEKTKNALIKVQELGVKIVLASGRPTPGLRHEANMRDLFYLLMVQELLMLKQKKRFMNKH